MNNFTFDLIKKQFDTVLEPNRFIGRAQTSLRDRVRQSDISAERRPGRRTLIVSRASCPFPPALTVSMSVFFREHDVGREE